MQRVEIVAQKSQNRAQKHNKRIFLVYDSLNQKLLIHQNISCAKFQKFCCFFHFFYGVPTMGDRGHTKGVWERTPDLMIFETVMNLLVPPKMFRIL